MVNGLTFYSLEFSVYTASHNVTKSYILPIEYLYVLCVSQKKQWSFPYKALADWFV
jgi:hypothetical protein